MAENNGGAPAGLVAKLALAINNEHGFLSPADYSSLLIHRNNLVFSPTPLRGQVDPGPYCASGTVFVEDRSVADYENQHVEGADLFQRTSTTTLKHGLKCNYAYGDILNGERMVRRKYFMAVEPHICVVHYYRAAYVPRGLGPGGRGAGIPAVVSELHGIGTKVQNGFRDVVQALLRFAPRVLPGEDAAAAAVGEVNVNEAANENGEDAAAAAVGAVNVNEAANENGEDDAAAEENVVEDSESDSEDDPDYSHYRQRYGGED